MRICPLLMSQAKDLARELFGIGIPIEINHEALLPFLGKYDFMTDRICIYEKFITEMVRKRELSLDEVVNHIVCHEHGHAKEARLFAYRHYFPYIIQISQSSVMTIDSLRLPLQMFDLRTEIQEFFGRIDDFTIDRKLHDYGLVDHMPKNQIEKIEKEIGELTSMDTVQRVMKKVLCLLNLPTYLNHFEFGVDDRTVIKEYSTRLIGESVWNEVLEVLRRQTYGASSVLENSEVLYSRLFGFTANWRLTPRRNFEAGFQLPSFWSGDDFFVLYLD